MSVIERDLQVTAMIIMAAGITICDVVHVHSTTNSQLPCHSQECSSPNLKKLLCKILKIYCSTTKCLLIVCVLRARVLHMEVCYWSFPKNFGSKSNRFVYGFFGSTIIKQFFQLLRNMNVLGRTSFSPPEVLPFWIDCIGDCLVFYHHLLCHKLTCSSRNRSSNWSLQAFLSVCAKRFSLRA